MEEPGLLYRRRLLVDLDGSVVLEEVWDLDAPGCVLATTQLSVGVDRRNYHRQVRLSAEEYRYRILGLRPDRLRDNGKDVLEALFTHLRACDGNPLADDLGGSPPQIRDWRNHIGDLQWVWPSLSREARIVAFIVACEAMGPETKS